MVPDAPRRHSGCQPVTDLTNKSVTSLTTSVAGGLAGPVLAPFPFPEAGSGGAAGPDPGEPDEPGAPSARTTMDQGAAPYVPTITSPAATDQQLKPASKVAEVSMIRRHATVSGPCGTANVTG